MNFAKCILCGHDAQSNVFTEAKPDEQGRVNEAPGEKYDCPECGLYARDNYEQVPDNGRGRPGRSVRLELSGGRRAQGLPALLHVRLDMLQRYTAAEHAGDTLDGPGV